MRRGGVDDEVQRADGEQAGCASYRRQPKYAEEDGQRGHAGPRHATVVVPGGRSPVLLRAVLDEAELDVLARGLKPGSPRERVEEPEEERPAGQDRSDLAAPAPVAPGGEDGEKRSAEDGVVES